METLYFIERKKWRNWLEHHFEDRDDIWLEYPKKKTGKKRILYNDAVEEALCFGWIDSTVKSLNEETTIQRFCKRRKNSRYSQANKERLKWLQERGLLHESMVPEVAAVLKEAFIFPQDIMARIQSDEDTWQKYQQLSKSYQRIRIAYINSARKRPDEFEKRLSHFISKTTAGKLIKGFGGIDKYY